MIQFNDEKEIKGNKSIKELAKRLLAYISLDNFYTCATAAEINLPEILRKNTNYGSGLQIHGDLNEIRNLDGKENKKS